MILRNLVKFYSNRRLSSSWANSNLQRRLFDEPIGDKFLRQLNPLKFLSPTEGPSSYRSKIKQCDPSLDIQQFIENVPDAAVSIGSLIYDEDYDSLREMMPEELVLKIETARNFVDVDVLRLLLKFNVDQVKHCAPIDVEIIKEKGDKRLEITALMLVKDVHWDKVQEPPYWIQPAFSFGSLVDFHKALNVIIRFSKQVHPTLDTDFGVNQLNFFHPNEFAMKTLLDIKDKFM